jgi:hypothetical protein
VLLPNHAVHFPLHFLVEWLDFEVESFQSKATGKEKTPDRNVFGKLQLQLFYSREKIVNTIT